MKDKFVKKSLMALLTLTFAFGCAACGGSGQKEETGNGSTTSETPAPPAEPVQKVELSARRYIARIGGESVSVSAVFTEDGDTVDGSVFKYSVADESIAEVNENGVIIPKLAGKTAVTVTSGDASATADIAVVDVASAAQVNSFDEVFVNLYGRVYKNGTNLALDYSAAGLEVAINGTSLTADIAATAKGYLCVYVDGAPEYQRFEISAGQKEYTLASGLESGYHLIRIVKSSEVFDGQINIRSVSSEGFYNAPEKSSLRIEFIGDSITTGYGVLGNKGESRTIENSDACSSYAYQAAKILDADYSTIAIQGICVKVERWISDVMYETYPVISPLNKTEYGFDFAPDVVVLNLGTNDASYLEINSSYASQFYWDYLSMLKYIRGKNPEAYVICLYGMMGKETTVDKGINRAIAEMEDEKVVRWADFSVDQSGANGHPEAFMQGIWGEDLAAYIENLLGI